MLWRMDAILSSLAFAASFIFVESSKCSDCFIRPGAVIIFLLLRNISGESWSMHSCGDYLASCAGHWSDVVFLLCVALLQ